MIVTLRVLSALLRYPDEAVQEAAPLFASLLAEEGLLGEAQRARLAELTGRLIHDDLLDSQEAYVALFDRGRALSLHLFEHVHGESRDRGQAMVDLRDRYEASGLEIAASELPDFLPLFLEYLSLLPIDRAMEELAQPGVIIAALAERLEDKNTPYAAPMRILAELAGSGGEEFVLSPADDPDDLCALDAQWEEEQVRFEAPLAPGSTDCPQAGAMVQRMLNPQPARSPAHG